MDRVPMIWLAVALAGAAGTACRYVVDFAVTTRGRGRFPWGTLAVNLSGALLVGLIAGLVARGFAAGATMAVMGAGFCGAYTTFSTLAYQTWRLLEEGAYLRAAANLASLAASLPAVAFGWALAALP